MDMSKKENGFASTLSTGYLRCVKRKTGPSQWDFLWRENVGGRRIRRTAVIGSIDEYPTEELAQVALNGFRVRLNFHDIGSTKRIVTILEFRCQCHFWRLTSLSMPLSSVELQ